MISYDVTGTSGRRIPGWNSWWGEIFWLFRITGQPGSWSEFCWRRREPPGFAQQGEKNDIDDTFQVEHSCIYYEIIQVGIGWLLVIFFLQKALPVTILEVDTRMRCGLIQTFTAHDIDKAKIKASTYSPMNYF